MSRKRKPGAPRTRLRYTHAFVCYGMPLSFEVTFKLDRKVLHEGRRKCYCRNCLERAAEGLKIELKRILKAEGLR